MVLVSYPESGIGGVSLLIGGRWNGVREAKTDCELPARPVMCRLEFQRCRDQISGKIPKPLAVATAWVRLWVSSLP